MWVAQDPASVRLLEEAQTIAAGASPVLIHGEPGSGKGLLATLIHELSHPAAPLVHFAAKSLPTDLIEVELFGEETAGYVQRGRIELAHGGTLVIDELAALPEGAQQRLLNVIQEQSFRRPGGTRGVNASVRVIALTTLTPARAQQNATIRGDLLAYFRDSALNVPVLRERAADIVPLALRFIQAWTSLERVADKTLSPAAAAALQHYSFPGNVAELKLVVEQAAARSRGNQIGIEDLPQHLAESTLETQGVRSLEDVEREHIAKVLEFTKGRKTEAADILGISRKTLLEKRKRYGLG